MKIQVNQQCINFGRPHKSSACPVAQAIWEQVPGASKVRASYSTVSFEFNKQRRVFTLSQKARQFIHNFDAGHTVEPISIILPYFSKPQQGGPK